MIKLEVAEYCHECLGFEVEEITNRIFTGEILLKCKHRYKCKVIKDYLERNKEHEDAR